jgi:hypothetical protein
MTARRGHAEVLDAKRRASKHAWRWRCGCVLRGALSPIKGPLLDKSSRNGVQTANLAPVPGRWPGDSGWRGECGSRELRLVTLALGRLGQDTPGRHHDRTAGAISLGWDSKARVTPASDAWEAGLRPSRRVLRCARLSNHRGARAEQVPGSRVARAERWRSVAAVSAVVERREASGPLLCPPPQAGEDEGGGRAASRDAAVVEQRFSAFRFPFRHCEAKGRLRPSSTGCGDEAIQTLCRRPWIASSLRSSQ